MTWTLVSDRTPEPGQTVLAWWWTSDGEGTYDVVVLKDGTWRPEDDDETYFNAPRAWAALPPPPEINI